MRACPIKYNSHCCVNGYPWAREGRMPNRSLVQTSLRPSPPDGNINSPAGQLRPNRSFSRPVAPLTTHRAADGRRRLSRPPPVATTPRVSPPRHPLSFPAAKPPRRILLFTRVAATTATDCPVPRTVIRMFSSNGSRILVGWIVGRSRNPGKADVPGPGFPNKRGDVDLFLRPEPRRLATVYGDRSGGPPPPGHANREHERKDMKTWVTCLAGTMVLALSAPAAPAAEDRPAPPQRGAFFERLDADKDGRVVIDDVPDRAPDWVRELLRRADRNRDGQVTREEMAKQRSRHTGAPGARFGRRPADQKTQPSRPSKVRFAGPPRKGKPGPHPRPPACPWCGRGAMRPWGGWGHWGYWGVGPATRWHASHSPRIAPGGRGPAMHHGPWGPRGPWHAGPMMGDRTWSGHRGWDRPAGKPRRPEFSQQRPRDGRGRWSPADRPGAGKPPVPPSGEIGRSPRTKMADPGKPDRPRPGREVKKSEDRPRPGRDAKKSAEEPQPPTDRKTEAEKKTDDAAKAAWWR